MKKFFVFLFIVIASTFFFLYKIKNVSSYIFDELHYLNAVKGMLASNILDNLEHPPLGKFFIYSSMHLFGDDPLFWRLPSAIMGGLSIGMIYLIVDLIIKDYFIAFFMALISVFNFMIFVNARTAILEIFMLAFVLVASYFLIKFRVREENKNFNLFLGALFSGVAIASKWSAVFVLFPLIVCLIDWKKWKSVLWFGATVYYANFICYLPYMLFRAKDQIFFSDLFFKFYKRMLDLLNSVHGTHPYDAKWYTWIIMKRPIWLHFAPDPTNANYHQGIIEMANPLLMIIGLISLIYLLVKVIIKFSKKDFKNFESIFLFVFLFSWGIWNFTGRSFSFFYYFLVNYTMYMISIPYMLNDIFKRKMYQYITLSIILIGSIGLFYYFYPILSGKPFLNYPGIEPYMWFKSWI